MKYCKDCRYCGPITFGHLSDVTLCLRNGEPHKAISPVTGQPFREQRDKIYCEIERESLSDKACGKDARYFAAKLEVA